MNIVDPCPTISLDLSAPCLQLCSPADPPLRTQTRDYSLAPSILQQLRWLCKPEVRLAEPLWIWERLFHPTRPLGNREARDPRYFSPDLPADTHPDCRQLNTPRQPQLFSLWYNSIFFTICLVVDCLLYGKKAPTAFSTLPHVLALRNRRSWLED